MKIFFAGDHAGFELKKTLIAFVQGLGHETEDLGPFAYEVTDDYPDFVIPLAKKVATNSFIPPFVKEVSESSRTEDLNPSAHQNEPLPLEKGELRREEVRGIVAAGSGQGEIIAMNRIPGVRAVVYYGGDPRIVKIAREHNNSNILAIGTRFASEAEARTAVKIWLETPFSGDERHVRRLRKIDELVVRSS